MDYFSKRETAKLQGIVEDLDDTIKDDEPGIVFENPETIELIADALQYVVDTFREIGANVEREEDTNGI